MALKVRIKICVFDLVMSGPFNISLMLLLPRRSTWEERNTSTSVYTKNFHMQEEKFRWVICSITKPMLTQLLTSNRDLKRNAAKHQCLKDAVSQYPVIIRLPWLSLAFMSFLTCNNKLFSYRRSWCLKCGKLELFCKRLINKSDLLWFF